jgi:FkbM family methyltransferase
MEIDHENFLLLEENTRHYPNVQPLRKGLWSKETKLKITNPDAESWSFQASEARGEGEVAVDAMGVEDVLSNFAIPKVDVLKIDIEGGEFEVFDSGVNAWIDRVGMIAVEVHDRFRPGCTDVIRRALEPFGFEESLWSEYLLFRRSSDQ